MYTNIYKRENEIAIDRQQQRDFHNARCYLNAAVDSCTDSTLKGTLAKALELFERAHNPIRTKENTRFDVRHSHYESVRQANGFKTVWSIYEIPFVDAPVTQEAVDIAYVKYYNQLVAVERKDYILRWTDLWAAADKAITAYGRDNHIFVEGFYHRAEDPPGVYQLAVGS